MKRFFFSILTKLLPHQIAYAHCDVPCGIYDPVSSQIAAATVLKMIEKIEILPADVNSWSLEDHASFIRFINTKEEHAEICKRELLILWTDYFKQEHIAQFPDLHDRFWAAAKLCSENKQHISRKSADKLVAAVNEISEIFHQIKTK